MDKLPKGWIKPFFTDVFDINGGTQPPKNQFIDEPKEGYIRLLQIRDFGAKPVPTYIPKTGKLRTCQKDDILIARYGASIGRIVTGQEGAYNVALAKVNIPHQIEKNFVKWLLKSYLFQNVITGFQRTAQSGFNKNDLSSIQIPLPPLPEQQRIVAKLDTLFTSLENTKSRLEKIPVLLKNFRQAVLTKAVTGKLTEEWRRVANESIDEKLIEKHIEREKKVYKNFVSDNRWNTSKNPWKEFPVIPDTWRWYTADEIRDVDAEIVYGIVQPGPKLEVGVPYVRGMDIVNGEILVDQLMRTSPEIASKYQRASLKGGDLLLGIIRNTKVATVPGSIEGANITQGTARIRPSKFILPAYLNCVFSSPIIQNWLHGNYRGIDMPGLNLKDVRKAPIPLASISEQQEIVRQVESLFAKADVIEQQYEVLKQKIDVLPQALLAKTFKGELVEQLETDGDAADLLKEIEKVKASLGKKKSSKNYKLKDNELDMVAES